MAYPRSTVGRFDEVASLPATEVSDGVARFTAARASSTR